MIAQHVPFHVALWQLLLLYPEPVSHSHLHNFMDSVEYSYTNELENRVENE